MYPLINKRVGFLKEKSGEKEHFDSTATLNIFPDNVFSDGSNNVYPDSLDNNQALQQETARLDIEAEELQIPADLKQYRSLTNQKSASKSIFNVHQPIINLQVS